MIIEPDFILSERRIRFHVRDGILFRASFLLAIILAVDHFVLSGRWKILLGAT